MNVSWQCRACKEVRPDRFISVKKIPLMIAGRECGSQNFNYCNDRPSCEEAADHFEGYLPDLSDTAPSEHP